MTTSSAAPLLAIRGLRAAYGKIEALKGVSLPVEAGEVVNHLGVTGLLLMIAGFMTFTFTLLLHSTAVAVWRRPERSWP